MKLSKVMAKHGWSNYELDKPADKLKVYQKDDLLMGVQKIGNVFRVDVHQCFDLGGMLLPAERILNNEIVPREQLEPTLDQLLPQLR